MRATVYEGYFNNGLFYVSGKPVNIPEQCRIFMTILDDIKSMDDDAFATWNDVKRMIAESAHENHLLTEDAFRRDNNSRDFVIFEDGELTQ